MNFGMPTHKKVLFQTLVARCMDDSTKKRNFCRPRQKVSWSSFLPGEFVNFFLRVQVLSKVKVDQRMNEYCVF
jgi:hypothetical protein